MSERDMQILFEQNFKFIGISSQKKKLQILNILSYCKEFRDTAYPLPNSNITELNLVEFTARKEKDIIYVNGSLSLEDTGNYENRCFDSYIINEDNKIRVYTDIIRLCNEDEPKMIRTSDEIEESDENISTITVYSNSLDDRVYSSKFPKNISEDYIYREKVKQLSAL